MRLPVSDRSTDAAARPRTVVAARPRPAYVDVRPRLPQAVPGLGRASAQDRIYMGSLDLIDIKCPRLVHCECPIKIQKMAGSENRCGEAGLSARLSDVVPAHGALMLATVRSHDQWNTTIYSSDDRYRGVKNLRTLVFMNIADMRARGIKELGLVDITSTAKDGSRRSVRGYRAITYNLPRGCAMGYMPELNVLCP